MNSLPNFEADLHRSAIDLSGLEKFLEAEQSAKNQEEVQEQVETETQVVLRLLDQLYKVGELVSDTSERLKQAHSRIDNLTTVITLQNKQVELLSHYQAQAARVGGLEHSLAMAMAENARLKQAGWRKIFFWLK
jgi:polysaccharide pyruvyl transferase WcaK-like protein